MVNFKLVSLLISPHRKMVQWFVQLTCQLSYWNFFLESQNLIDEASFCFILITYLLLLLRWWRGGRRWWSSWRWYLRSWFCLSLPLEKHMFHQICRYHLRHILSPTGLNKYQFSSVKSCWTTLLSCKILVKVWGNAVPRMSGDPQQATTHSPG